VKGRRVRLLTVAGVDATADVVAAADIPVGELQPALAKLVGGWQLPPDDPGWVLLTAGGTALRPGRHAARPAGAGRRGPLPPRQPAARPAVVLIEEPPHDQRTMAPR
jgi:hypothetical protein